MKSIIHSVSEQGFWHNKKGWVYRASEATKFDKQQRKQILHFPHSKDFDAEWMVIDYSPE